VALFCQKVGGRHIKGGKTNSGKSKTIGYLIPSEKEENLKPDGHRFFPACQVTFASSEQDLLSNEGKNEKKKFQVLW